LPGPGSASQRAAQQVFGQHGLTVTPIGEIDTHITLLHAIAAGIGNSILPWCELYDGKKGAVLNWRRFAEAKLVRPVALCFSDVGQRSPAIDTVALTLKSLVHELVADGTWQGVSLITPPAELSRSLAPP
jgi:LysR family transcriptional regulator, nitrogen assimilation regulatory protein